MERHSQLNLAALAPATLSRSCRVTHTTSPRWRFAWPKRSPPEPRPTHSASPESHGSVDPATPPAEIAQRALVPPVPGLVDFVGACPAHHATIRSMEQYHRSTRSPLLQTRNSHRQRSPVMVESRNGNHHPRCRPDEKARAFRCGTTCGACLARA